MSKLVDALMAHAKTASERHDPDDTDAVRMLIHIEAAIYLSAAALALALNQKPE